MCFLADNSTWPHIWCFSLSLLQSCTLLCFACSMPLFQPVFPFFLFICGSSYLSFSLIIYFHLRFSFLTSGFLSVWHSCWLPNYLAFHKCTQQHTTTTHILSAHSPHTKRKIAKASHCLQSNTKAVCLTQTQVFILERKDFIGVCVCVCMCVYCVYF